MIMVIEKIATSASMELSYQTEGSILIFRVHGFLKPGEAAKDGLTLNEAISKKKIRRILIDQRGIKVLSKEMQSFIIGSANEMAQKGIKKMAILPPEDVFALAGISKIQSEFKTPGIEIANFSSEEEGLNWLRQ
jgi:hypothetical protein